MALNRRAERAKIFAPFDALKGFQEALLAEEFIPPQRKELTEDQIEAIDYKLRQLTGNPTVTVTYYSFAQQAYLEIIGKVTLLSPSEHIIQIEQTIISFSDIYNIDGSCFDY